MSDLKPRFPLPRPSRANGALLPAACAAALAAMAGLQLALTADVALPGAGWTGGGARAAMPAIQPSAAPAELLAGTIFTPERTGSRADTGGAQQPLGGAAVAGTISLRGRTYAIVQRADGSVARLAPGGRLEGLRLLALTQEGAVFEKDGRQVRVPFGPAALAPAAQAAEQNEEEEQ